MTKTKLFIFIVFIAAAITAYMFFLNTNNHELSEEFAVGNGRIETTQVDIASKLSGRLEKLFVEEGDIVQEGELIAQLDVKELTAKLQEAVAHKDQAIQSKNYAKAIVKQRESELTLAKDNYNRAHTLYKQKSIPLVEFQRNEKELKSARAALSAAQSQVISAQATINASQAQIQTIKVNIEESKLYSPIKGRVLYKIAQNGEIIANGGKVAVVLDLMNTYMTIFLPTAQAGRVDINAPARIVLDALPEVAIPSYVTFVSPLAQFTPKDIETQTEREKLMFRVKVKIDSAILEKYFEKIKTGLPGMAYIKLKKDAVWPDWLNKVPKEEQ